MEGTCRKFLWGALPVAALLAACGPKAVCGNGVVEVDANNGIIEFCDDGTPVDFANGDRCDGATGGTCKFLFDPVNHICELPAGFKGDFASCCNSDNDCNTDLCLGGF